MKQKVENYQAPPQYYPSASENNSPGPRNGSGFGDKSKAAMKRATLRMSSTSGRHQSATSEGKVLRDH